MKIGIGNDHSALELKAEIISFLKEKGHEVVDYGTNSSESCDYPVYGEIVARAVAAGEVEQGILICGTGLGISLAANTSAIKRDFFSTISPVPSVYTV